MGDTCGIEDSGRTVLDPRLSAPPGQPQVGNVVGTLTFARSNHDEFFTPGFEPPNGPSLLLLERVPVIARTLSESKGTKQSQGSGQAPQSDLKGLP